MKWQDKLSKKQHRHLREMGITTLRQLKRNSIEQAKMRAKGKADNLPPGIAEPCIDCRNINIKLGLPI